jgi:acetylornithine deacetylase/succinyl-diaminopimelate desuccinylase-like protein
MDGLALLKDLLRINTINPPGNERDAAELLEARLTEAGVETKIFISPSGRASVVGRAAGSTDEPAIVLLSHLDVVGVEEDKWSRDPFGAEEYDGHIWGRGALDMKGIVAMHAAAIAQLARADAQPNREVIIAAVADEEAGGNEGAAWLVDEHPDAVGFGSGRPPPDVIGEGAYGVTGILKRALMPIALGEKSAVWLELHATGEPGHGALPPSNQATLNLMRALDAVAGGRTPRVHPVMREQFGILAGSAPLPLALALRGLSGSMTGAPTARVVGWAMGVSSAIGAVLRDTITPTRITAGYKHNVVPGSGEASLDCRLLPDTDIDEFVDWIRQEVRAYSVEVVELSRHWGPVSERGDLFDLIAEASGGLAEKPTVVPSLTYGITDVRHFRRKGATGYGWTPLILAQELLATIHGHDERIPKADFERAVELMSMLVRNAARVR